MDTLIILFSSLVCRHLETRLGQFCLRTCYVNPKVMLLASATDSQLECQKKACRGTVSWAWDDLRGTFGQVEEVPTLLSGERKLSAVQWTEVHYAPVPTKMFPLKTTLQDAVRVVNWLCIVTCVGDYSLVLSELNSKFRGNQLANFWKLTCCILQNFLLLC